VPVYEEPVFDEAGVLRSHCGTSTDVTQRMQLREQLQEQMEPYRITREITPVPIGLMPQGDNAVLLANDTA